MWPWAYPEICRKAFYFWHWGIQWCFSNLAGNLDILCIVVLCSFPPVSSGQPQATIRSLSKASHSVLWGNYHCYLCHSSLNLRQNTDSEAPASRKINPQDFTTKAWKRSVHLEALKIQWTYCSQKAMEGMNVRKPWPINVGLYLLASVFKLHGHKCGSNGYSKQFGKLSLLVVQCQIIIGKHTGQDEQHYTSLEWANIFEPKPTETCLKFIARA